MPEKKKFTFKGSRENSQSYPPASASARPVIGSSARPDTVSSAQPASSARPATVSSDLEDVDWGEDDFDMDFQGLDGDAAKSQDNPKITDEELNEMSMALINDDSIFEFDEPPAALEPAKNRLNQTMAMFESMDDFFEELPQEQAVIATLRDELKNLNAELKKEQSEKTATKVEKDKLQDKLETTAFQLERELKLKKNLELDQRREVEKLKRSEKESETELKRLKKELEAAKLKAEAQAAMALKPLAPINQNSEEPCIREGNKRKRVCLDPDVTAVESTDVKQETETPEPPKPEMPVPVVWHLPDFFLEQFCCMSTTDLSAQNSLLIKSRAGRDCRETWAQMLNVCAENISNVCNKARTLIIDPSSTAASDKPSAAPDKPSHNLQPECHIKPEDRCRGVQPEDRTAVEMELKNIVNIIIFCQESLKSHEMEIILDVATQLLRFMLEMDDHSFLCSIAVLARTLLNYELPEGGQLKLLCDLLSQNLGQLQASRTGQLENRGRGALLDLYLTIASEDRLLSQVCTKSESCFLQAIMLELEAGCYKVKLVRDVMDLFNTYFEDDSPRSEDDDEEEDLTENYNIVLSAVEVIKRFIDKSSESHFNTPWLDSGCIECNTVLLRSVVALIYCIVTIHLDRTSDLSVAACDQTPSNQTIVESLENLVAVLYTMKMEVVQYKHSVTQPWIKVVERIKIENKKRYIWSLGALKHIIREPHLTSLQALLMERAT